MTTAVSANQWFYRAEGNNNVIFADVSNSRVLRLPKIVKAPQNYVATKPPKSELTHEIEFLEHVVYKLLKDVHIRYKGEKMPLTRDFIRSLSQQMNDKRPERYRNEKLDESIEFGLLLPNYCKLLSGDLSNDSLFPMRSPSVPTISVEIRPKTCYFPDWGK